MFFRTRFAFETSGDLYSKERVTIPYDSFLSSTFDDAMYVLDLLTVLIMQTRLFFDRLGTTESPMETSSHGMVST